MEINQENDVLTVEQLEKQIKIREQVELYEYNKKCDKVVNLVLNKIKTHSDKKIICVYLERNDDAIKSGMIDEIIDKICFDLENYSLKFDDPGHVLFRLGCWIRLIFVSKNYKPDYSLITKFLINTKIVDEYYFLKYDYSFIVNLSSIN